MVGMESSRRQLVVCTAGHIDHGKSRLVQALTGTNPDRLPEEQARGMTIDLGFAHLAVDGADIHFVDVPGHERFIRNMVAGASGVDVALLVVAADDSVMPQTREHAELLRLLGVSRCVLVVTKTDLVDEGWAAEVEAEGRGLLDGLGLSPVACVRTSAESGRGLEELKRVLAAEARREVGRPGAAGWFRMPIDRAFLVKGRGVVVTGTVTHGALRADEGLELWRTALDKGRAGSRFAEGLNLAAAGSADVSEWCVQTRVRGLQSYHAALDAAAGRMRLAVNLAHVELEDVGRGCELATPGYLTAAVRFDAWIHALTIPGRGVRDRLRVRLHIAAADVLAQVRLAGVAEGGRYAGAAQVRTAVPIVAEWGERFILRDESGARTLGGGEVLRCPAPRWTVRAPLDVAALERLRTGAAADRVEEVIRGHGWTEVSGRQLAAQGGVRSEAEASAARAGLVERRRVVRLWGGSTEAHVHRDVLERARAAVQARLARELETNPRMPGVARGEWTGWMPRACPPRVRPLLAGWLLEVGAFVSSDGYVLPRGHRAALSGEDEALYEAIVREYEEGAYQPPSVEGLRCRTERNARRVGELVKLAVARGRLVSVGGGLLLHGERARQMAGRVAAAIRERGPLAVSDIRTLLDSSRKFVVPLVEHLDAIGVTRREGDLRVIGPNAPAGE